MNVRNHAGVLAVAAVLAMSLLGSPALHGRAFAEQAQTHNDKASCQQAGYYWSDEKGCADKQCWSGGQYYEGGDVRFVYGPFGEYMSGYVCNGFTGQWDSLDRQILPANPRAPLTGSSTSGSQAAPLGPQAPIPLGSTVGH